jgi:chitin disaccharide deacetylase
MKSLIVSADDFGASPGINRGILEAHHRGILTSTSLLVDTPWSQEAASRARTAPDLSVGLHVHLRTAEQERDGDTCRAEILRQWRCVARLVGRAPSHLDLHHNVHRDPRPLPAFLTVVGHYGVPLREHSTASYVSQFYGQWGGQSHPEQISVEGLLRIVEADVQDGVTELSCHPGYVDPDCPTGYATERAIELRTLCDPTLRPALAERQILLVAFHHLGNRAASLPKRRPFMATVVISPVDVLQLPDGGGHFWVSMHSETRYGVAKRAVPRGK